MKNQQTILRNIGKTVRRRRKQLGLTQEALGERSDLHLKYVGSIERGEVNLSVQSLAKIADGLGCEIADLFGLPVTLEPAIVEMIRFCQGLSPKQVDRLRRAGEVLFV